MKARDFFLRFYFSFHPRCVSYAMAGQILRWGSAGRRRKGGRKKEKMHGTNGKKKKKNLMETAKQTRNEKKNGRQKKT